LQSLIAFDYLAIDKVFLHNIKYLFYKQLYSGLQVIMGTAIAPSLVLISTSSRWAKKAV
jgi:hypothetical protein